MKLIGRMLVIASVVCIVLGALAWPRFNQLARKAKTVDAWDNLRKVHKLQHNFRKTHGSYATTTDQLAFVPVTGGLRPRHVISIEESSADGFVAYATATGQDVIRVGCGKLDRWKIDESGDIKVIVDCTAFDGVEPLRP